MAYYLQDYLNDIEIRLKETEDDEEISEAELISSFTLALSIYSHYFPRIITEDLAIVNGQISLADTDFQDGFSVIQGIEFPIGNVPPTYLTADKYVLYRSPSGLAILFSMLPSSGTARVSYTTTHEVTTNSSTVPNAHYWPLCALATAQAARVLIARYSRAWDPTFAAEIVNFQSKAIQYQSVAREYETIWQNFIRTSGRDIETGGRRPSMAIGSWDTTLFGGGSMLTHSRRGVR